MQTPEAPPIYGLVVAFAENNLRRQILRSATKSPRTVVYVLSEPEIAKFQVPISGN